MTDGWQETCGADGGDQLTPPCNRVPDGFSIRRRADHPGAIWLLPALSATCSCDGRWRRGQAVVGREYARVCMVQQQQQTRAVAWISDVRSSDCRLFVLLPVRLTLDVSWIGPSAVCRRWEHTCATSVIGCRVCPVDRSTIKWTEKPSSPLAFRRLQSNCSPCGAKSRVGIGIKK